MNKTKPIISYLIDLKRNSNTKQVPTEIISALNHLNRVERGDLKAQLFNEAKKMSLNESAQDSLFWLENCFLLIEKYTFRFHQVFFSPGGEIPETILGLIKNAEQSIELCIFTISHYELAKELLDAQKRGIKIRLLTDDEKQYDKGSRIKHLHHEGIAVKTDNSRYHMHHKFGIIDERMVFTGSFNWTYTASKHNQENLLVTTNYTIVQQYRTEFERLWTKMKETWIK
jgi:phosphatidylserine/phosphatidylglycerophosphate/cardiolipin synthase-like enzyme